MVQVAKAEMVLDMDGQWRYAPAGALTPALSADELEEIAQRLRDMEASARRPLESQACTDNVCDSPTELLDALVQFPQASPGNDYSIQPDYDCCVELWMTTVEDDGVPQEHHLRNGRRLVGVTPPLSIFAKIGTRRLAGRGVALYAAERGAYWACSLADLSPLGVEAYNAMLQQCGPSESVHIVTILTPL